MKFNRVPEKVWEVGCRAKSGSTGFWTRFRRRRGRFWCIQQGSGVVPEKVPEKAPGGFGVERSQIQQGCGEGSEVFSVFGFCENTTLRLLRIP